MHAATADRTTTRTAAPAAADRGKTSVSIAPANRGIVRRDQELQLTVTVTNDTDTEVPEGSVELDIFRSESTRDVLSDWLADTSTTGYLGAPMDSADVPAVPAHRSVTQTVTIAPGNVALGGYSSFGARRIAAEYTADDTSAVARSAITWYPDFQQTPVGVSVAMPITLPATADGVISAADLAAATAVDGTLTQQLDAAADHNVALGVDPRIIASIRLLGENAPSSARTWLDRLEGLRNETFALPWADADVTGLRQAGADGIPGVISLDQEVREQNFPGASTPTPTPTTPDSGTPTATAGAAPDETPDATPTSPDGATADPQDGATQDATGQDGTAQDGADGATTTLPTTASLLDFPYALDDVAWPVEDTLAADDLPALAKAGTGTTIVASGNTSAGPDTTVAASERIGDQKVLVADQGMSALLREAATATDQPDHDTAMAELTATLATAARSGSAQSPVLLTLGREWPTDSTMLSSALDALEDTPWVSPSDLSTAAQATAGSLTLAPADDGSDRLDQLRRLVESEQDLTAFASAVDDPTLVTAPARLRLLALSSNAWRDESDALTTAVAKQVRTWTQTTDQVSIPDSSSLTLLGDRSSLPVSVRNRSEYPITVLLDVQPSSSALQVVRNAIEVKLQPQSSTRTTIPVRSVANGKVSLTMSLTTTTGVTVSEPTTVELNVQAQWETVITAVAAIGLVAIFGFGIFRSIRKRIRRRNGELDDEDDDDPNRPLAVQPDAPGAPARSGGSSHVAQAAPAAAVVGTTAASGPARVAPQQAGTRPADATVNDGGEPRLQAGRPDQDDTTPDPEEPIISTQQQPAVDAEPAAERNLGRASAMLAAGTMLRACSASPRPSSWRSRSARTVDLVRRLRPREPAAEQHLRAHRRRSALGGAHPADRPIDAAERRRRDAYVNKIVTLGATVFVVITIVATVLAPFLVFVYSQQASVTARASRRPDRPRRGVRLLVPAPDPLLRAVLAARRGPERQAGLRSLHVGAAHQQRHRDRRSDRVHRDVRRPTTAPSTVDAAEDRRPRGSASLGVFAQAAFLPFFWKRAGLTFRPDFRWRGVGLKATGPPRRGSSR